MAGIPRINYADTSGLLANLLCSYDCFTDVTRQCCVLQVEEAMRFVRYFPCCRKFCLQNSVPSEARRIYGAVLGGPGHRKLQTAIHHGHDATT